MVANVRQLARWQLWCVHRLWWRLAASLLMIPVIGLTLLRLGVDDGERNLAQSRKTLAALRAQPVPDEENAAVFYERAHELMLKAFPADADGEHPRAMSFDSPDTPETRQMVARMKPVIDAIEQGNKCAKCYFAHAGEGDSFLFGLSNDAQLGEATKKLCDLNALESLARAQGRWGEHRAAAHNLALMRGVCAHWDSQHYGFPIVGSFLDYNIQALQQIALISTPRTVEEARIYVDSLCGERMPYEDFLQTAEERVWAAALEVDCKFAAGYPPGMSAGGCVFPANALEWLAFWADEALMQSHYAQQYTRERREFVSSAQKVLAEIKLNGIPARREWPSGERMFDFKRNADAKYFECEELLSRALWDEIDLAQNSERIRCAETAFAALAFRIKYGRDIRTLDELVPEFMAAIPASVVPPRKPQHLSIAGEGPKEGDDPYDELIIPVGSLVIESALNGQVCKTYIEKDGTRNEIRYDCRFYLPPMKGKVKP
ncbi:MAG TPA: hypothetical protein VKX17_22850 [Planctomycetota bacterium]|nr:hypothetical protein [Planctomycetota bacterium]